MALLSDPAQLLIIVGEIADCLYSVGHLTGSVRM